MWRTDVWAGMSIYISLVDLIFNIKREKHCKKLDIDLILERCEDKPDDVRKCVEDLVRVGVLNRTKRDRGP